MLADVAAVMLGDARGQALQGSLLAVQSGPPLLGLRPGGARGRHGAPPA
jgi:hypothetical protein